MGLVLYKNMNPSGIGNRWHDQTYLRNSLLAKAFSLAYDYFGSVHHTRISLGGQHRFWVSLCQLVIVVTSDIRHRRITVLLQCLVASRDPIKRQQKTVATTETATRINHWSKKAHTKMGKKKPKTKTITTLHCKSATHLRQHIKQHH